MFETPIDFVKAGKLTTTLVAAAIDPSGLVIAGATAEAVLTAHDEFSSRHKGLAKITKASEKRLKQSLKDPRFTDTDNLHSLLWSKLEHCAGPIADADNPIPFADDIYNRMRKRLSSFENRTPRSMTAFEDWMRPELGKLCDDPDLLRILGPAIERHKAKERKQHAETLAQMQATLQNPASQSDEVVENLAARFGLKNSQNYSRSFHLEHLHKTADDFQRITADLAKFEAKNDHISHLHAKALKALKNFDRNTAKTLLAEAKKLNNLENLRPALEENAELSKTQAEIALLEGDAEQAYQILSAAADSFAVIESRLPTTNRLSFAPILCDHGLRYGGNGLKLAAQMNRDALKTISETEDPNMFGGAQNDLGNALQNQGTRTNGEQGADLLAQAVTAYRDALRVRTEDQHPVDWAMTQENLAIAYTETAAHDSCADPRTALQTALTHVDNALRVFDPVHLPYNHTKATNLRAGIQQALDGLP